MSYEQNRYNRNRKSPPWATSNEEMEYRRLEEWRKKQLQQQRQKQQRNARFQAAQYQPRIAEEQPRAIHMRSPEYFDDPALRQNLQAEILQTLHAFKEQHAQQYKSLREMVLQIQRQMFRLQKKASRLQQSPCSPLRPIVVKQEKADS